MWWEHVHKNNLHRSIFFIHWSEEDWNRQVLHPVFSLASIDLGSPQYSVLNQTGSSGEEVRRQRAQSWLVSYLVFLGQTPAIGLNSVVLLLDVSFHLFVLFSLLLSPGHHLVSTHSVKHISSSSTPGSVLICLFGVKSPWQTYSSLRKSKALLLSLGSCCRVLLLFFTVGWICEVGALYLTFTGASPEGFLTAPPDELNRRLKLKVSGRGSGRRDGTGGRERQREGGRGQTDRRIEGWTQAVPPAAAKTQGWTFRGKKGSPPSHQHTNTPCTLSHRQMWNLPWKLQWVTFHSLKVKYMLNICCIYTIVTVHMSNTRLVGQLWHSKFLLQPVGA